MRKEERASPRILFESASMLVKTQRGTLGRGELLGLAGMRGVACRLPASPLPHYFLFSSHFLSFPCSR